MTGPEHYKEAERLLACAAGEVDETAHEDRLTAQVHATLALAAAAALPAVQRWIGDEPVSRGVDREWFGVIA